MGGQISDGNDPGGITIPPRLEIPMHTVKYTVRSPKAFDVEKRMSLLCVAPGKYTVTAKIEGTTTAPIEIEILPADDNEKAKDGGEDHYWRIHRRRSR